MLQSSPQCIITFNGRAYDLATATDISLHVGAPESPKAFGLPPAVFEPYTYGDTTYSVELGAPLQCEIVTIAPHANGTHTECVGHLAGQGYTVNTLMKDLVDEVQLVTVNPTLVDGDTVVMLEDLEAAWTQRDTSTLVLRTLPNGDWKRSAEWVIANAPYIHVDAMDLIVRSGIRHLITDVPTVDRLEDQGVLASHHRFWQWPYEPRLDCTLTELVYVPSSIADGRYLVLFNVAPLHSDAAPSRPMLVSSEHRTASNSCDSCN
ncbi:MAG: cyclase family protein [Ignavibacteria bacterium]|jgi:arylformamidase